MARGETDGEKMCHFRQFNGPPSLLRPPSSSAALGPPPWWCPTNFRPWLAPTLVSSKRGQSTERAEDDPHPLAATLPTTATQYRFITHPAPPTTQPPSSSSHRLPFPLPLSLSRFNPLRPPHFTLLTSLRSYHSDETRAPTNFYCYFSRCFL